MALERLSLAPSTLDADPADVAVVRQGSADAGDETNRTPRLPRWTRQEILVLIQGKRVAENRVRRGRTAGLPFGSGQVEPKWASVSSYCKRHGVNRGPVQCRKRWSNLAGDFKKIKEWESQIMEETESFWVMRNDLRREKKLPGFFDREVYDILDSSETPTPTALALAPSSSTVGEEVEPPAEEEEEAHVFDSGRTAAAADDGLFSDDQDDMVVGSSPGKKQKEPPTTTSFPHIPGTSHVKETPSNPEVGATTQEGRKRKRLATDGDDETYLQSQLIKTLERNGRMLSSQLEVQNTNFQLDREQRKDHGNSLIAVLNKLADALGRIADKL